MPSSLAALKRFTRARQQFERLLCAFGAEAGAMQFDRLQHATAQSIGTERGLRQVVVRTCLHQLDGELFVPLTGEDHQGEVEATGADALQYVQSVHLREAIVEQYAVELRLVQRFERVRSVRQFDDLGVEAGADEGTAHGPAIHVVVVDQ